MRDWEGLKKCALFIFTYGPWMRAIPSSGGRFDDDAAKRIACVCASATIRRPFDHPVPDRALIFITTIPPYRFDIHAYRSCVGHATRTTSPPRRLPCNRRRAAASTVKATSTKASQLLLRGPCPMPGHDPSIHRWNKIWWRAACFVVIDRSGAGGGAGVWIR